MSRRNAIPRTQREREARERALAALALMRREKRSLTAAARAKDTNPRTVRRYVGSALRRKGLSGRYKAKPRDRLLRVLRIPTRGGNPKLQCVIRGRRAGLRSIRMLSSSISKQAMHQHSKNSAASALPTQAEHKFRC